jgi:hypothetical protein
MTSSVGKGRSWASSEKDWGEAIKIFYGICGFHHEAICSESFFTLRSSCLIVGAVTCVMCGIIIHGRFDHNA